MLEFYKDKNILVAGGVGFVGTNLILKLLELKPARLCATYHFKEPLIKDKGVEYIQCDLTDKEACLKAVNAIDLVFMCAANTSGALVIEKNPLVHVTPNVIMNTLLLDAAYQEKVKKFLFISSNTVYPQTDHPVKEDEVYTGELFEKYFCVGWMKRFTEILCQMYTEKIKNPMACVVVRPANIYGPYSDFEWKTSHVIPALIRKAVERHNPIEVWGNGNDIKDFIYIDDFINGLLLAMEKINPFEPLNLASGNEISIKQALQAILEADNYNNAKIAFNSSKPTMIPKRLIDTSKAKRLLNFEAKTPFKEGIKKTIDWYKSFRDDEKIKSGALK